MREIQDPELQIREIPDPVLQIRTIPDPELQIRKIPDPKKPIEDPLFTVVSSYANLLQQKNFFTMFNTQRIGLEHQHDHRFIVFVHQYGEHDVMLKFSNDLQGCTTPLL